MSVYLYMNYKDKQIASLGVADFTCDTFDDFYGNSTWNEVDQLKEEVLTKVIANTAYTPKDREELEEMTEDIKQTIEFYTEELIKKGRRMIVSQLNDNEDIAFEMV